MIVYFSTVVRSAPADHGGELVKLDWERKEVLARVPIAATRPAVVDPNPRGNTRGGRGITILDDGLIVCSFHSLRFFDFDLSPTRDLTHPLMVSLHENVRGENGTLWTSSTAIDAALEVDLATGALVRSVWPRELPGIQAALDVTPLDIDKAADNRARFLGADHYRHPHHLHLNALARLDGDLLALFSKHGVIANLDRDVIVVRDKALKGSHNLVVDESGLAFVNQTVDRAVCQFDLRTGERRRKIRFADDPVVRRLARRHDVVFSVRKFLERRGLHPASPPRPLFVRGLVRRRGRLFVGVSPATILELDEGTGRVVDHYVDSRDVRACVHGLEVVG